MVAVVDTCVEVASVLSSYLVSSGQRLYIGYLLTAVILAYWVYRRSSVNRPFWRYVLDRDSWLGASAQVDYALVVFNGFVKVLLLAQFTVYGLGIAFWVDHWLGQVLGPPAVRLGEFQAVVAYTIVWTVFGDFTVYLVHRLMHRIPALWAFHSVHHSAQTLNPVTQLRLHPVELFINNLRSLVVFGLVMGLFDYLAGSRVEPLVFLGVNVFSFAFFTLGANLRHSHIPLRFWHGVEHVLCSPFQHQIHHSRDVAHHDRNFASKFTVWDWMFGTLVTSRGIETVEFGLDEEHTHRQTLLAALIHPFRV